MKFSVCEPKNIFDIPIQICIIVWKSQSYSYNQIQVRLHYLRITHVSVSVDFFECRLWAGRNSPWTSNVSPAGNRKRGMLMPGSFSSYRRSMRRSHIVKSLSSTADPFWYHMFRPTIPSKLVLACIHEIFVLTMCWFETILSSQCAW